MTIQKKEFFECNNPECRLRFPGYVDAMRWKRCPACRSDIHSVAEVTDTEEVNISTELIPTWNLEGLLDNIRSAWNVGSIFRTSDGIGINKLYLCGFTTTPENPKVTKTALGADQNILWEQHNNSIELVKLLKSRGYILWVLEYLPGAQDLFTIDTTSFSTPVVMIIGNEVCGVDPEIIQLSDKIIYIPMYGKKRSYNVAVAYGIAASYLLYRHKVSQESRNILPNT